MRPLGHPANEVRHGRQLLAVWLSNDCLPMLFCLSDHPPLPLVFLVDAEPDGRQITLKLLTMEYCMTQDLSATKDRVAQALYVLGGLASLAMLLMFAGFLVAIVDSMQNDGRYFRYEIERAMFSIFWASLAYGLGWGFAGSSTALPLRSLIISEIRNGLPTMHFSWFPWQFSPCSP